MKIIVDMMGGDHAPLETVRGVALAMREYAGHAYILVGDEAEIRRIAAEEGVDLTGTEIVPAASVVTMEDDPVAVVRTKKDSSMAVALQLLSDGKGDAVVSTGNTGALFTGAMLIVKKIKGLQRAGIAAVLPAGVPMLLVDSGANVEVTEENLEQFAIMGSTYMKLNYGVDVPRVGLLNNGSEACKGTPLYQAAHTRLAECPHIHFIGNVEGSTMTSGCCDVLVADGFTGNIMMKTFEGAGKMILSQLKDVFYTGWKTKLAYLLLKKPLGNMKRQLDPNEVGGAPLLGIAKPVIKAHGSSRAVAFKNAIGKAILYAQSGTIEEISSVMEKIAVEKRALKDAQKAVTERSERES